MSRGARNRRPATVRRQPPATRRAPAPSGPVDHHDLLPPWDRGPVRAYVRDVVDSRRHLTGLFMPFFAMALITIAGPASELADVLRTVSLVALAVMAVEVLARGLTITRMARAEFPDLQVNAVSTTNYAFMRMHRPRSMRKPAPRLRAG